MSDSAVILAAGRGLRLRPFTDLVPKALQLVAGRPIIDHIFTALQAVGVRRFFLVTGYRAEEFTSLQPPSGCSLQRVVNRHWEETNSMFSLSMCAKELSAGGYIVEGDCCFDQRLFVNDRPSNGSCWFARPFSADDDGCCLHANEAGKITSLSIRKRGAPPAGAWKSCGVVRVSPPLAAKLPAWLECAVQAGRQRDYYDLILGDHLPESGLWIADIASAPWHEVDNEEDLQRAGKIFGKKGE